MALLDRRRRYGKPAKPDYLKFKASQADRFTLTIGKNVSTSQLSSISYSVDGGKTWTTVANRTSAAVTVTTPTIPAGGTVLWKGIGNTMASSNSQDDHSTFSSSYEFEASGNVMSLLFGDSFESVLTLSSNYTFAYLFANSKVTTPPSLPATTVPYYGYSNMFYSCQSLKYIPDLPYVMYGEHACHGMFYRCTALRSVYLRLHYYGLSKGTCNFMFANSSLTSVTISFTGTVPESCFAYMFSDCSNLSYIKAMFTSIAANNSLDNWVYNVRSTGTFVKNSAATWNKTGSWGVPNNWTLQYASS